ncbi:MAG: molybdopterin-synthase adenylyltransferase MoeB [Hyphomicrobiales bacterium]|nr:molybdopterin-synthase adenylyltransferase MoeB [Hyphomicrobiales bacterium]
MDLTPKELERYARHILLRDVGGAGQHKLKKARVLVIGAGGLGSPVLMYLAAAGVGTLGVIDDDDVDLSNLQRQVIHKTSSVGQAKTASASETIEQINPHVKVNKYQTRLDETNALEIIGNYDIVADGCDNFKTRFLVSDACFFVKKPLVSAAVGQFDGQISTFKPYLRSPDGNPYPSYRTFHPQPPRDGMLPTCAEAGIIGTLTAIIGSMQAMEVIKEILNIGDTLAGRVVMYDSLATRCYSMKLGWSENDPLNGTRPTITKFPAPEA